jgi:hypothetical protein
MTRTDVAMKSTKARRRTWLRRLMVLPVALLLVASPASAIAATTTTNSEGLSGYKHEEKTAKQETSPSKSTKPAPAKESEPATSTSTPITPTATTATTTPAKEGTLPFTGFDLRWTVGFGLLLMGAGVSIVSIQRRQRRSGR